jgi:hypothetical protein
MAGIKKREAGRPSAIGFRGNVLAANRIATRHPLLFRPTA